MNKIKITGIEMNNNKVIPGTCICTCSRESKPTPLNKIKDTECKVTEKQSLD